MEQQATTVSKLLERITIQISAIGNPHLLTTLSEPERLRLVLTFTP
jgi:hypothetical protein